MPCARPPLPTPTVFIAGAGVLQVRSLTRGLTYKWLGSAEATVFAAAKRWVHGRTDSDIVKKMKPTKTEQKNQQEKKSSQIHNKS